MSASSTPSGRPGSSSRRWTYDDDLAAGPGAAKGETSSSDDDWLGGASEDFDGEPTSFIPVSGATAPPVQPSSPSPSAADDSVRDDEEPEVPPVAGASGEEPQRRNRRQERARAKARKRAAKRADKAAWKRRPLWRGRILPRSVLGISLLMLCTGMGAAVSGTVLYMNYQHRRDVSDELVKTFPDRAKVAVETVQAEEVNARRRIQDEIEPIRKLAATGDTLRGLITQVAPSVFEVRTFDVDGAPTVGTAFVVASDNERSFLLTSLDVVRAATYQPGPVINVRKGTDEVVAELWSWQDSLDLALLIVKKPSLPRLDWAVSTDVRLGQQVFAVSGLGTGGGSITQGFVANVSSAGLQHSAPLGAHFRGGPLITDRGTVVAIASKTYAPLGFPSDGVWFAAPIRTACESLLRCPEQETTGAGQVTGAGANSTPLPPTSAPLQPASEPPEPTAPPSTEPAASTTDSVVPADTSAEPSTSTSKPRRRRTSTTAA